MRKDNAHYKLYTNTQIHHNLHPNVENGLARKRGKAVLIPSQSLTYKHNTILHNSPPNIENELGKEQEKAVIISTHTLTHKHSGILSIHQLALRMHCAGSEERQVSFPVIH